MLGQMLGQSRRDDGAENQPVERAGGGDNHQTWPPCRWWRPLPLDFTQRRPAVGFLFRWHGKPTEIGFGSARDVTLARARELAGQARATLAEGINPKETRKVSGGATFGECADRLIEAMRSSWRNAKHAAQWEMTLLHYAAPIRRLPVDKITTEDVLSVLKPLWSDKPETASRLRGRVERVLDAAKAQGLRNGETQRAGAVTWINSCPNANG